MHFQHGLIMLTHLSVHTQLILLCSEYGEGVVLRKSQVGAYFHDEVTPMIGGAMPRMLPVDETLQSSPNVLC